jgi:hypothetical protein
MRWPASAAVPELDGLEFLIALAFTCDRCALTKDAALELGADETSSTRARGRGVVSAAARHSGPSFGRARFWSFLASVSCRFTVFGATIAPHEYGMALEGPPRGFGMVASGDST